SDEERAAQVLKEFWGAVKDGDYSLPSSHLKTRIAAALAEVRAAALHEYTMKPQIQKMLLSAEKLHQAELSEAQAKIEKLREALKFYADRKNWRVPEMASELLE